MSQNKPLLFTPTSEDYHTLSFKLNSFPTGLPAFALVLLQATKQSEWSLEKVNHVNSMMSFFCLEPSGAAHLTYCVSQIPCLRLWLWMNQPPDSSTSSSPTSSLHSLSSHHTGLFAVHLHTLNTHARLLCLYCAFRLVAFRLPLRWAWPGSPVIQNSHAHVIQYLSPISPDSLPTSLGLCYVLCL